MQNCNPDHFRRLSRRGFLSVGALAGAGLTLPELLRSQSAYGDLKDYKNFEGTAKSVIHIYLPGGMAHQESFDPKPNAPIEYRGEMKQVATKISGELFGETLGKTAEIADKLTVIRSMTHGEAAHERGTHNMFTGYRPSPALQYPCIGSVVSHEYGPRNNLPPYVCIPNMPNEYAGSGYLSSAFAPFSLGSDPAAGGFKFRDLDLPGGVDDSRFATRRSALEAINAHFQKKEKSDDLSAMNTFYDRAYSLISAPEARQAFDLEKESAAIRDEYGRNTAGARMLLARRLVQAGVRLVNLTYGGWDMHGTIEQSMKRRVPALDHAIASFITDVASRGMSEDVLLVISGEFGRTPRINRNAGRDHWAPLSTLALAGGSFRMGQVVGESMSKADVPKSNPIRPQDLMATIFHHLGLDPKTQFVNQAGRPVFVLEQGQTIGELI